MKKSILAAFAVFLSVFVLSGGAVAGEEIIVSAAASLTNAFTDLGKQFEAENPGVKVVFNFAASGVLLQQMENGAPVDVFASADQKTMDQAAQKGLVAPETRRDFAANTLVLIVPADGKVKSLADLKGPGVSRIALGTPETVPVGRYTKESLTAAGTWDALSPKFVYAENVRQVLDYVARGEVDAGFVYATDAAIAKGKVKTVAEVAGHKPVTYPIALVKTGTNKDSAAKFTAFVTGKKGRKVLADYGFRKP